MNEDLKKYIRRCTIALAIIIGINGFVDHMQHSTIEYKIDQLRTNQGIIQDSNNLNELYDPNSNKEN